MVMCGFLGWRCFSIYSCLYLCLADIDGISLIYVCFGYQRPDSSSQFEPVGIDCVHLHRRAFHVGQLVSVGKPNFERALFHCSYKGLHVIHSIRAR